MARLVEVQLTSGKIMYGFLVKPKFLWFSAQYASLYSTSTYVEEHNIIEFCLNASKTRAIELYEGLHAPRPLIASVKDITPTPLELEFKK